MTELQKRFNQYKEFSTDGDFSAQRARNQFQSLMDWLKRCQQILSHKKGHVQVPPVTDEELKEFEALPKWPDGAYDDPAYQNEMGHHFI